MNELMTIREYRIWVHRRLLDAIIESCYCQVGVVICLLISFVTNNPTYFKLAGLFALASISIIIGRLEQIRRKNADGPLLTMKEFYGTITFGIVRDVIDVFIDAHKRRSSH